MLIDAQLLQAQAEALPNVSEGERAHLRLVRCWWWLARRVSTNGAEAGSLLNGRSCN